MLIFKFPVHFLFLSIHVLFAYFDAFNYLRDKKNEKTVQKFHNSKTFFKACLSCWHASPEKGSVAVILSPRLKCQFTFLTVGIFEIACHFLSVERNMLLRTFTKMFPTYSYFTGLQFLCSRLYYRMLCWCP